MGAVILYSTLTLTPLMMQGVLGYPVKEAGYLSMPRGVTMIVTTFVVGRLDAFVDRRLMVSLGLALIGLACWRMSHFDLAMSPGSIAIASALQGVGQGMTSVSLSTLAFATIGPTLRPDASAITTLLRNIAASISVASMQGLTAMNAQAMHASLSAHLDTADPVVRSGLPASLWPGSVQGVLALDAEISRQAMMVAYLDDFRLLMLIALLCAPLVLLLRRPPVPAGLR
jgi:DHA2 family multidrug resistance protein